jgi:ketosteroid isomerase-like protein
MRMLLTVATVLSIAGFASVAQAQDAATLKVLNHHITAIKASNLADLMADYADDALVVTPHGLVPGQKDVWGVDVFAGKANVQKVFAVLCDKDHQKDIVTMTQTFEDRGNGTVLMHWTQHKGTPQEAHGTDIWVIKNGKVVTQILTAEPAKK